MRILTLRDAGWKRAFCCQEGLQVLAIQLPPHVVELHKYPAFDQVIAEGSRMPCAGQEEGVDRELGDQFADNHPVTATTTSTGESKVVLNAIDRVHLCPIKALPFGSSVSSYLLVVPGENDVRMCRSRQPFGSCNGTWNCG